MDQFKVVIDREQRVWERTTYIVNARSLASAIRKVDMGHGWEAKGVTEGDYETLYDTMEGTGEVELMKEECEKI